MSLKSLLCKILPVSLTRSRFCAASSQTAQWFQDFADREGGGGAPETAPSPVQVEDGSIFYKSVNTCRPYRSRVRNGHSLALRPRLRAGLDCAAPFGAGSNAGTPYKPFVDLGRNVSPTATACTQLVEGFASFVLTLTCACVFLSATAVAQSSLTPRRVITDPTKLESESVADMQAFSIERLTTIGGSTWSPRKQVAFVTNISGRNNIWIVPANGGWPTQLTISDQRQTNPAWSPDGNWIAYASDYDGNEQWDVFAVSPKTGEVRNLTTTKETSEDSPVWSPDSKYLAYVRKEKGGSSYEIDVMEFSTRRVKHITKDTPSTKSNFGPIFSRDGQSLVYTQADAGDRIATFSWLR